MTISLFSIILTLNHSLVNSIESTSLNVDAFLALYIDPFIEK